MIMKAKMTEQQIQAKRIKELEAEGYYVIKLVKTNKNGIPDLIAIPPNSYKTVYMKTASLMLFLVTFILIRAPLLFVFPYSFLY